MYCSQCGKKIREDGKFCEFCGKEINSEYVAKSQTNIRITKSKWLLVAIIATIVLAIAYLVVHMLDQNTEPDISVGGNYYGSYEHCDGSMPLGIDDNVWGMTKEEFQQYTGILLGENVESDMKIYERYELPIQFGYGYKTDSNSYVLFFDGYGLSMVVLDAGLDTENEVQVDLAGEMLNWLDDHGTFKAKKDDNSFILYELHKSYALIQNKYLKKFEPANLRTFICYVSKESYRGGKNFVSNIDDLMVQAERNPSGSMGIPLAELSDGEDRVFTLYADDIVEDSIEIISNTGPDSSEYAVGIDLKPEKADELEAVTTAYALNYLDYQTLRTEEKEIHIGGPISSGDMTLAYFEDEKTAKAYANWLKEMIEK